MALGSAKAEGDGPLERLCESRLASSGGKAQQEAKNFFVFQLPVA
jgi:hypothetical protein